MSTIALSGSDSVIINNRILVDFADGDWADLSFPSEIASVKTGKNGNSIYGLNEMGKQADLKLRMVRGSSDDKFLNSLLLQQQSNFAGFILMIGEFIKQVGDGQGNIAADTYILSGGVFVKQIAGKSNAEGDSAQSISIYEMKFSLSPRTIT